MSIENLIIIGSWPAGHTAAIYAGRAMLNPLMFEWFMAWGVAAGWQLTTTTDVENFPGFPDGISWLELMSHMRKQSLNSGTRIETKTVDKVDLSANPFKVFVWENIYYSHSLIIATWATAKRLNLPGETEYRQRGISACAVCDWALPLFREKHLVVIWWGDSACEEAHYLTKYASKITMLVRRDALRASKVMQERVINHEKIEILWNTEAIEVLWDGKVLTDIKIIDNKTNQKSTLKLWGLFYAIGHKPNTDFLWWQLKLDESGYIITYSRLSHQHLDGSHVLSNENVLNLQGNHHFATSTSVPWVFAAWDVTDKIYRQAITSAWTGCMAALDVEHYLQS